MLPKRVLVGPTKVNTGFEARLPPKRVFGLPDVNNGRPVSGWPSRPRNDMCMLVSGGHATQGLFYSSSLFGQLLYSGPSTANSFRISSSNRRPDGGGPVYVLLSAAGLLLVITAYCLGSLTATGLRFLRRCFSPTTCTGNFLGAWCNSVPTTMTARLHFHHD